MSTSNTTTDDPLTLLFIFLRVKFWTFLLLLVLLIVPCIFVLYHLLADQNNRSAPKNHVAIIILALTLLSELTMYPGMLYFFRLEGNWDRPFILCILWAYYDYTYSLIQINLMTLASIQRHILIFHDRWMSTKIKRICVHYLPIVIVSIYSMIIYAVVFFFPTCGILYTVPIATCFFSCMLTDDLPFIYYDTIMHQILPVFVLTFFNLMLIARVIWQKYRVGQRVQWRKHRKMAVQFLAMSSVYVICVFPYSLGNILIYLGITVQMGTLYIEIAVILCYVPSLLLPLVCGLALPEMRNKIWRMVRCGRQSRVAAMQGNVMTIKSNRTMPK